MDAGNRAGINAVGNAFAYIGNNTVGHDVFSLRLLYLTFTSLYAYLLYCGVLTVSMAMSPVALTQAIWAMQRC